MKNPRASPNTCGSTMVTPVDRRRDELHRADRGASRMARHGCPRSCTIRIEIFAVSALRQRLGELEQLFGIDEAEAPGDLLHAGHLQSLPLFDNAHEHARIEQRIVGAGIEPRRASSEPLDVQSTLSEIHPIEIRDFQFAARRRLQGFGQGACASVVEVNSGNGVIGRRPGRLFEQVRDFAVGIEFNDAVALGILDVIAEHRRACGARGSRLQELGEIRPVEDIVAEDQRRGRSVEELFGDDQRLRNAVGLRLHRVLEAHAPLLAAAEKIAERGLIPGRGDDQEFADPRRHQSGQRIVDHRLVVHRQELLALRQGNGVKASACTAGENDSFAE